MKNIVAYAVVASTCEDVADVCEDIRMYGDVEPLQFEAERTRREFGLDESLVVVRVTIEALPQARRAR